KKWIFICRKPLSQCEWCLQKRHLQIDRGCAWYLPKKLEMLSCLPFFCKCIALCTYQYMDARTGLIPGQKQCNLLKGVCKDGGCTSVEQPIGVCNEEKRCCRK
ncbi:hypothetical protein Celaphus_00019225, partial [Cervus elaphus hippelaphus]